MEVAVKPKESTGPLKCAYCHADDGEVRPCPGNCGSYRHDECKTADKKCPTLGCIYGCSVEQIKEPPPEIIELAKRMGVAPLELWPPKQAPPAPTPAPQPRIDPNSPGAFFEGLDRASAHHASAFHTLLSHTQEILNRRLPPQPEVIREAHRFANMPWPDELRHILDGPMADVRAELDKVREELHASVEEIRREAPKIPPRPAPPASLPPAQTEESKLPCYICGMCSGYGRISIPHMTELSQCEHCNGYGVVRSTEEDESPRVPRSQVYDQIRCDPRWTFTKAEGDLLALNEFRGTNPGATLRFILKRRLRAQQMRVVAAGLIVAGAFAGLYASDGPSAFFVCFVLAVCLTVFLGWLLSPPT